MVKKNILFTTPMAAAYRYWLDIMQPKGNMIVEYRGGIWNLLVLL